MRRNNAALSLFFVFPALLLSCQKGDSFSTSLDGDGYALLSSKSDKEASFSAFEKGLKTLTTSEEQGWHYDEDPTLGKNDKDISLSLLTLQSPNASSSSKKGVSLAVASSDSTQKVEKDYSLSLDAESADVLINNASAPNIDKVTSYANADKVYVYGLSEEEGGSVDGGAIYIPSTKGYLKGGVGYLDISKDSSLKTAINTVVHSSFPGNDSWEVPDKIAKTVPPLASWLSLSITSDGPAMVSAFIENLRSLEAEGEGHVLLYRKGVSYRMRLSLANFDPIYRAIDDVLKKETLSGKLREYLYDFKDAVISFSLSGTLDYGSDNFSSASLKVSFEMDKDKLRAFFPDLNVFVTSFSGTGIFTPLSGDAAKIVFPDLTEFVTVPEIK